MKQVGKHIAKHHPLYGFEGGVLALLLLLFFQIAFSLYAGLQNFGFLSMDIHPWVKFFIYFHMAIIIYGYVTLAAALSRSHHFPKLFYVYLILLILNYFTPYFFHKNIFYKSILGLSKITHYTDLLTLCFGPYLYFSNRARITFKRLLKVEDLDLIRAKLLALKEAQDELRNKNISTKTLHEEILDQDLFQDLKLIDHHAYDLYRSDAHYDQSFDREPFSPFDFLQKHTIKHQAGDRSQGYKIDGRVKVERSKHKAEKRNLAASDQQEELNQQAKALFESFLKEKKKAKEEPTKQIYIRAKGIRQARLIKSARRFGKNPAQHQLLKNYHHRPKTESKVKPIHIYDETLEKRPASKKEKTHLGFSSKYKK